MKQYPELQRFASPAEAKKAMRAWQKRMLKMPLFWVGLGKYPCPWEAPSSSTRARVLAHATHVIAPRKGVGPSEEGFGYTILVSVGAGQLHGMLKADR